MRPHRTPARVTPGAQALPCLSSSAGQGSVSHHAPRRWPLVATARAVPTGRSAARGLFLAGLLGFLLWFLFHRRGGC